MEVLVFTIKAIRQGLRMVRSERELRDVTFPAQYIETVESLARNMGKDTQLFYRSCGIEHMYPCLPGYTINGRQMQSVLRYILSLCPAELPPIVTFMGYFPLTSHGPIGILAITSATLGDALHGTLQYSQLVMPAFRMRREDLGNEVHIIVERQQDLGEVNDFFTETVVMTFLRIEPFLTRHISNILLILHTAHWVIPRNMKRLLVSSSYLMLRKTKLCCLVRSYLSP